MTGEDSTGGRQVKVLQMFAPNVGQASRAGCTEKKKKITLHDSDLYTIALNSIKKAILMI